MLPENIIDFRFLFVTALLTTVTETFTGICNKFGSSRKTGYKWMNRYKKEDRDGLRNKSKAPKKVWNKTPKWIEHLVCNLYHCGIEPEEIYLSVKEIHYICEKTVYNILHRNKIFGRANYEPKIRRYQYKKPNQLWHIDITKFRIKGQGTFYIIAIIDNCSRKIVGIGIYKRQTAENVVETFKQAVRTHGKPIAALSDNGKQFTSKLFQQFCKSSEIKHRRTRPYNPKCNGKIERWFKDLKKHLKLYWFESMEELDQAVNRFVQEYNYKPKRVLKWKTPAEIHC